jgi:hypothetical protein
MASRRQSIHGQVKADGILPTVWVPHGIDKDSLNFYELCAPTRRPAVTELFTVKDSVYSLIEKYPAVRSFFLAHGFERFSDDVLLLTVGKYLSIEDRRSRQTIRRRPVRRQAGAVLGGRARLRDSRSYRQPARRRRRSADSGRSAVLFENTACGKI